MSPLIRGITIPLLLLPLILAICALIFRQSLLNIPVIFLILLYAFVWLWCRPYKFVLTSHNLQIVFPVWCRQIPMQSISNTRIISAKTFKQEFGWAIRIGVGGLWGGFGWLWTQNKGFVEFYISQTDNLFLIEHSNGNNLLITPTKPQEMLQIMQERRNS
jgi:hypothetical protein